MWNALKTLALNNKILPPNKIIDNGKVISSPKKLANLMNDSVIENGVWSLKGR